MSKTAQSPPSSTEPRVFTLLRRQDETGVSGTGRVLDGVIFHTGQVVACWRTNLREETEGYSSITVYPSWEAFRHVHVDPHPKEQTSIVFGPDLELDHRSLEAFDQ
jgi:hypothetical protein